MIKIHTPNTTYKNKPTDGNKQKQKKIPNKGYVRASFIQGLSVLPLGLIASSATPLLKKTSTINPEQIEMVKPVIADTLEKTGLADKGVKTLFVETYKKGQEKLPSDIFGIKFDEILQKVAPKEGDSRIVSTVKNSLTKYVKIGGQLAETALNPTEKDKEFIDLMAQEGKTAISNNPYIKLMKKLPKKQAQAPVNPELNPMNEELLKEFSERIQSIAAIPGMMKYKFGNNACYTFNTKTLIIPDDKLTLSAFHEMGHALNANKGKISALLQKMRGTSLTLPAYIALIALTNPRKNNDEQKPDDGIIQKGRDFVKRNAGKLSFIATLPMITEEAIATIKGNKLAKTALPKDLYKRVKLSNALGLSTYIAGGLMAGIGIASAVKYKDKIQEKYEHKLEVKAQKKAAKKEAKLLAQRNKDLSK